MNITYVYNNIKFEATVNSKDELYQNIAMIKSTIYNLSDEEIQASLSHYTTITQNHKTAPETKREVQSKPQVPLTPVQDATMEEVYQAVFEPLASDAQKKYMDKLGISYDNTTTKGQAIDLINEWKVKHNIPVNGN